MYLVVIDNTDKLNTRLVNRTADIPAMSDPGIHPQLLTTG